MDVTTVVLIAVTAWISLVVIVVALCRAAAHADSHSERYRPALH